MANAKPRKPRIRKSAPTIRERVEAAQAKASEEKPQRVRRTLTKVVSPAKKVRLPENKVVRILKKVLRPIGKVLHFLVPKYLVNSFREVRQVAWPGRRETWRLTGAVFVFAAIFGALVALVDKLLDIAFKNLVLK